MCNFKKDKLYFSTRVIAINGIPNADKTLKNNTLSLDGSFSISTNLVLLFI